MKNIVQGLLLIILYLHPYHVIREQSLERNSKPGI